MAEERRTCYYCGSVMTLEEALESDEKCELMTPEERDQSQAVLDRLFPESATVGEENSFDASNYFLTCTICWEKGLSR